MRHGQHNLSYSWGLSSSRSLDLYSMVCCRYYFLRLRFYVKAETFSLLLRFIGVRSERFVESVRYLSNSLLESSLSLR